MRDHRCSEDHDDGDDESVKTNSLSENEDEDHTNEDSISLGIGSDTSITSDTNGQSSSEGAKSASKSSSEILVSISLLHTIIGSLNLRSSNDCNNNTINTQDTSHNNWNKTLENLGVVDDSKGGDTNSGLSGTIGSSEVSENESGSDTNVGKEVWSLCRKGVVSLLSKKYH